MSTDTAVKTGSVKHGMTSQARRQAEPSQRFDACGSEERQVLNRKGIAIGMLQCQNASTAMQSDKKRLYQQANQAMRHLLTQ